MVTDVVCRMHVDESSAKFKSEYNGNEYFFCCSACKKSFDGNPAKYV